MGSHRMQLHYLQCVLAISRAKFRILEQVLLTVKSLALSVLLLTILFIDSNFLQMCLRKH